jgi:hypothetical protein
MRSFLVAATTMASMVVAFPRAAEARGRVGFRGPVVVRGFFGWPYYYGLGAPYWGFDSGLAPPPESARWTWT